MNPKYRLLYLIFGFAGLLFLIYYIVSSFAENSDNINPGAILLIAIPDLIVFFLAYKTYPVETEAKR